MVDLAYSYDVVEKLLDARTAPSNHAAPAAPAASVNAGHANAIARVLLLLSSILSENFTALFMPYRPFYLVPSAPS